MAGRQGQTNDTSRSRATPLRPALGPGTRWGLAALLLIAPALGWETAPSQLPQLVSSLRQEVERSITGAGSDSLGHLVPARALRVGRHTYDLGWLYDAVRSSDRTTRTIAWDRLKGWEATLRPRAAGVPPDRIAATTRAVLSAEEYRPLRGASWIDPWLPHLERLIDLLLAPLRKRGAAERPSDLVRGLMLYAAVLFAAAWLVARLVSRPVRAARPVVAPTAMPGEERTAAQWRRFAEESSAAGNLGAAFGAYYLELLVRLDEQGRLDFDPTRTSREIAERAPAELRAMLQKLAALAEGIFYGGRPAGAADVALVAELAEQARREL